MGSGSLGDRADRMFCLCFKKVARVVTSQIIDGMQNHWIKLLDLSLWLRKQQRSHFGMDGPKTLPRSQRRNVGRGIRQSHWLLRKIGRPRSWHTSGTASAIRQSLGAIQNQRTYSSHRHARSIHQTAPCQPCVGLCLVLERVGQFQ